MARLGKEEGMGGWTIWAIGALTFYGWTAAQDEAQGRERSTWSDLGVFAMCLFCWPFGLGVELFRELHRK